MKVVNRLAPVLLTVVALATLTAGSGGQTADPGATLVSVRVRRLLLHDSTMLEGVAKLSSEHLDLSFAFEDILKAKFSDPPASQRRFDLDLENRTISEILDELCRKDGRYAWTRDGLTINVYPTAVSHDKSYLLNRRLAQFELKGVTNAEQAVFSLVSQLPAPFEQIACAQAGGDTSYANRWNGVLRGLTVRQAFNLVARNLGVRGGWIFSGSQDFRTIGFHKGMIQLGDSGNGPDRMNGAQILSVAAYPVRTNTLQWTGTGVTYTSDGPTQ
jgi:hypothetical protein